MANGVLTHASLSLLIVAAIGFLIGLLFCRRSDE